MFIFICLDPKTDLLRELIDLDQWGFGKNSVSLETNMEVVFAAGDVRPGSTKQVASGLGEGATAALMFRQLLQKTEGSRGYKGS